MIKRYLIIFLLTISAIASHAQWTALSGPPGGNVQDMERTSTGTLYLVVNQKLYTSTNGGDSWAPVAVATPSNLNLNDLTIDANNKMYAVNYSQVFTSTDGGLNWTKVSTEGQFYGVNNIMKFGPDNRLAVYGWNGMYVSTDDGINWIKIHNTEIVSAVSTSAGTLYAASTSAGIKRYAYPGAAGPWNEAGWTLAYAVTNDWGLQLLADVSSNPNIIYAATYYNSSLVLKATDDNPTVW